MERPNAGLMFNGQHDCLPSSTYRFESGALFQCSCGGIGIRNSLRNCRPQGIGGSTPSTSTKGLCLLADSSGFYPEIQGFDSLKTLQMLAGAGTSLLVAIRMGRRVGGAFRLHSDDGQGFGP